MTITKNTPDPPKLEEPNQKYVERGWGWKLKKKKKKNFVYWSWTCQKWQTRTGFIPDGTQNLFYLEIVEDFPMPPDELDGYRLTFVPEEEWREKLMGKTYAFLAGENWHLSSFQRTSVSFPRKAYALAEKIETQVDDFGNEMPSSLPPMPEAPEGYKRKYEVGPTERINKGTILINFFNIWNENWEGLGGYNEGDHYIRLVPEKRYWSKPSDLPSGAIWVMSPENNFCALITSVDKHTIRKSTGRNHYFKEVENLRWSDRPFGEYKDGKECLVEG